MGSSRLAPLVQSRWMVPLLLVLVAFALRLQGLFNPAMGYDEQYYLLVGDRMLHGALPYVDIFDRKPVGLFLIYAAIRLLGGDGFVMYKLVATLVVALTAYLIYRAARPISDRRAACIAALLYIVWLNFLEGGGGQSPIFYNPLMLAAAMLVWRGWAQPRHLARDGAWAMLLVGLAIQIKTTAVFEGLFFGLALLAAHVRARRPLALLLPVGLMWVGLALLPTLLVVGYYARVGALQPFIFANVYSIFGRNPINVDVSRLNIIIMLTEIAPLLALAGLALQTQRRSARWTFALIWFGAALLALLVFGNFLAKHYALPLLPPAVIVAAPFFVDWEVRRAFNIAFIGLALAVNQISVAMEQHWIGTRADVMALADAARPDKGCIFVADGYPALYMLTGSCVPTRWPFPPHLRKTMEASPRAIGVDPLVEVQRILATRPDAIIDNVTGNGDDNPQARALVTAAERRDYVAVRDVPIANGYRYIVYRRRDLAAR